MEKFNDELFNRIKFKREHNISITSYNIDGASEYMTSIINSSRSTQNSKFEGASSTCDHNDNSTIQDRDMLI